MFNKMFSASSNASSETLSSFTSTNTTSSASPLTSSVPKSLPAKDYLAALGELQNTYGFAGGAPTPVALPKSSKPKSSSRSKPVTASSTAKPGQKDWEAAYGALSASYGFAGNAPVIPGKPSWLQK